MTLPQRRPWADFSDVRSSSSVHGARDVLPEELVSMRDYKLAQRKGACRGYDPISICLAYAQEKLIYDEHGKAFPVNKLTYKYTSRANRVNVFGHAYRSDATFWQHQTLADIVIGAAIHLHNTQGWTTVLYDGLRTVEGAFKLYNFATDDDLQAGLLALPGYSAHNKGLAVDSMMVDEHGVEVDMGGHFDHLDMTTNMRNYDGDKITNAAKKNRLIRESAFLRSAFLQDLLIAPLRSEFWDDRPPENHADLWRVLDSAARVCGVDFPLDREAYEQWNYADFLNNWKKIFSGHEKNLLATIGVTLPPETEKFEMYHGNYHPIYCRNLRKFGKNLTD